MNRFPVNTARAGGFPDPPFDASLKEIKKDKERNKEVTKKMEVLFIEIIIALFILGFAFHDIGFITAGVIFAGIFVSALLRGGASESKRAKMQRKR